MPVRSSRVLIAVAVLAASSTPSFAADRGKEKLPKLFAEPTSTMAVSVVRIKSDFKEVALGTVISSDGLVLTKGSELRGEITCVMGDGSAFDMEYVGYHKPTDLALLKIKATGLTVKPVQFADAKVATVGNWVAAADHNGTAIGVGVVSSGVRKLYRDEAVIENANKGYLGIRLADPEEGEGVVVRGVMPKGAAAVAGLSENDLISEVAGKMVKNRDKLIELLEVYRPGETITVRIKRGEKELSLKVKLGQRADFDRGDFQNSMGGSLSGRRTGFPSVIQHDTYVRPADCGGPLVDLDGKVLGINIARAGRVETWTLPADVITKAIEDLKSGKHPAPGQ